MKRFTLSPPTSRPFVSVLLLVVGVLLLCPNMGRADPVSTTTKVQVLQPMSWNRKSTATVVRPVARLAWGFELEPQLFWPRPAGELQVAEALGAADLPGTPLAGAVGRLFFSPFPQLRFGLFLAAARKSSAPYSSDGFERTLSVSDTFGGVYVAWYKRFRHFFLQPLINVGIGSWQYSLDQSDTLEGPPDWYGTLQTFRARYTTATFTRRLTAGYLGVEPQLRMGWQFNKWFGLQGFAGWRVVYVPTGAFAASTWNSLLKDSPVTNLSGPIAGIGIVITDHFLAR